MLANGEDLEHTAQVPHKPMILDPTQTIEAKEPTLLVLYERNADKVPATERGIKSGWRVICWCCGTVSIGGTEGIWKAE
jgi:hypothetical protein